MSMFHNPFNSKVVSDITRFLEEHKDDITINPCLDGAARQAAEQIGDEPILEDRRKAMRERFNDAVTDCGCRGTTKESNDFAKAVERYIEEKRKLPPEFLKNIQKKKNAAKKGEDAKKEEVEEESFDPLTEATKRQLSPAFKSFLTRELKWFGYKSVEDLYSLPPKKQAEMWQYLLSSWKAKGNKTEEVEEESWEGENRPPFGGILEDLSSGESHGLRFEKTNNPRRGAKSQGNKSAEAQYCLAVRKDGSLIGWIIPMKGTDGSVIGYGWYHGDPFKQPNAPFFSGRAGGFGSLAHTLSALKDQIGKQFGTKTESLEEAAKKRKQDPFELVYRKWFDRVPVDIMDIPKIAKEIEAALDSKADLEKVMPELVKKYRKG